MVSNRILFCDDDDLLLGARKLNDLNSAINEAFLMFKKFERKQGIQYAFHKFVVLCKRKFSIIVDGKAIKSTTQGLYLGYKLDFSKEAIISDAHANFQYDELSRLLPQYTTLCRLLNTKQELKVLTIFILPIFTTTFLQIFSAKEPRLKSIFCYENSQQLNRNIIVKL